MSTGTSHFRREGKDSGPVGVWPVLAPAPEEPPVRRPLRWSAFAGPFAYVRAPLSEITETPSAVRPLTG
jgi:hypothetical protein